MKRRQNSGRMFVIRQWKRFVLQMGIGLCLFSAKSIDGFAAPPMNDWFQGLEQREDIPKILLDARKNIEWEWETEGGRETAISLHREGGYIANQELRPGTYQVTALQADSGGRKFDCHMDSMEIEVETDRITLCRISVTPGSVYQYFGWSEPYWRSMFSGKGGEKMRQLL